jgi:hypothetical protein
LFHPDGKQRFSATVARGSTFKIEPFTAGSLLLELDGEVVDPGEKVRYIELISKPGDLEVIVPASE